MIFFSRFLFRRSPFASLYASGVFTYRVHRGHAFINPILVM